MLTDDGDVFIVDLGLCIDVEEFNPAASTGGTCSYMAPELLNGSEVTTAIDIWSLGITLLEMANGARPFSDNLTLGMFKVASKNLDHVDSLLLDPNKWSAEFKHFISLCLNPNPEKRPTAEYLLSVCSIKN